MKRDRKKLRLGTRTVRKLESRDMTAVVGGANTKRCIFIDIG